MSAGMSLGLQGGKAIENLALTTAPITDNTWKGMPVLVVVLLGGFAVNGLWCLFLNLKNKTAGDYVKAGSPVLANLFFAGLAGAIWTSQFICFKTGEPAMGKLSYVGWSVLFASVHPLRHLAGHLAGRMEENQRPNAAALGLGTRLPRGIVGHFRL